MAFICTPKQEEAMRLIVNNTTTLLEGGSRSGKTLIILRAIVIRALKYAGSKHLCVMYHFADAKRAIWHESMPLLFDLMEIKGIFKENRADWYYEAPNGSQIWIGGTDDKERADKILGQEYETIYFGEASRIPFSSYEVVRTRGNPMPGVKLKVLLDQNPPSEGHWTYQLFHNRKLPDGSLVPDNDFAWLKMNPRDNPYLSPEYIEKNLMTLSVAKRLRFLEGEYSKEEGSLWKREWIKYKKAPLESMQRIVIGVDPSGTATGNEVGILVAGTDGRAYYVICDYSMVATPKEWGDMVVRAYEQFQADCIVAEKNFGGEMVQSTITDMGRRNVNVKLVYSSRGKIVRAEPVSAMYERGEVYHFEEMPDLERELCTYTGAPGEASPNRMDACVFALLELAEGGISLADVV